MKKCLLLLGCLLALSAAASAQTVTFDLDHWSWDESGKTNAAGIAHNWVLHCDITSDSADINALGPERRWYPDPDYPDDLTGWKVTTNIGTPLQLILNGSHSFLDSGNSFVLCPPARRMEIARRFLQKGADPNDGLYHQVGNNSDEWDDSKTKFSKIDTPLGYAARNGKLEIAELLLQNGADPNYTWNGFWQQTDSGAYWDNNAHFALEQVITSSLRNYRPANRNQMIDLLVRYGADVNAVDDCGRTPLTRLVLCAAQGYADNSCPDGFNQRDYLNMAYQLRSNGASVKAKGQVQSSCHNSYAGMSARDVWKDYMTDSTRGLWEDFFKGR